MSDRENVIRDLQILRTWCAVDPIYGIGLTCRECKMAVEWLDDALELLKEQEAVVPVLVHKGANKQRSDYECPECHTLLYYGQRHCEWCGRKVKWND